MGTQTLGSTSNPGSTHFVWFSSSGVSFRANGNPQTTPDELYVDAIYVWASTHTGSRQIKHALYSTGGSLLASADTFHTFSTTAQWTHSEFSAGNFAHLTSGQNIVGAVFCTTDLEVYGNGSGSGRDMKEHNGTTFPSPWSTSNDVPSEGDLSWYLTYFPACSITSLPTSPIAPGATFTVVGQSFTAGVNSVTVNGVNCPTFSVVDDTHLSVTLPTSGVSSGPVVVNTNAGTATSGANLLIGNVYVDTGSAWVAIALEADSGSAWSATISVYADNGTAWTQIA